MFLGKIFNIQGYSIKKIVIFVFILLMIIILGVILTTQYVFDKSGNNTATRSTEELIQEQIEQGDFIEEDVRSVRISILGEVYKTKENGFLLKYEEEGMIKKRDIIVSNETIFTKLKFVPIEGTNRKKVENVEFEFKDLEIGSNVEAVASYGVPENEKFNAKKVRVIN